MNTKINVTKPAMPSWDDFIAEIRPLWDSRWLTNNGAIHEKFSGMLRDFLQLEQSPILFVNGHMALDIGIRALKLTGEVITTPFTFVSTSHAILMNGLKPIYCDIKESDYTIDESKIEKLITPRTQAILCVHVYGYPCNIEALQRISEKYGLKLIYDAAHAFGVKYKGVPICNYGDMSMLSFHATKVFHTIEGGALIFRDHRLEKKLELLKNFGIAGPESIPAIGYNAKMNEFQAAMGVSNLPHVASNAFRRRILYERYLERLSIIPGIVCPPVRLADVEMNYSYFPVLIQAGEYGMDRNALHDFLLANGVAARKYFYPLVTDTEPYAALGYHSRDYPVAVQVSTSVLTLPLYPDLALSSVDDVCDLISSPKRQ